MPFLPLSANSANAAPAGNPLPYAEPRRTLRLGLNLSKPPLDVQPTPSAAAQRILDGLEAHARNAGSTGSPGSGTSSRSGRGVNQAARNISDIRNGNAGVYRPANGAQGITGVTGPSRSFAPVPRPPDPTAATRPVTPPATQALASPSPRLPATANANAAAGGLIGALASELLGPVVEAAGGFVGDQIGAVAAAAAANEPTIGLPNGGRLGLFRYYPPSPEREGPSEPYEALIGPSLVEGGQSPGVLYRFNYQFVFETPTGSTGRGGLNSDTAVGPISLVFGERGDGGPRVDIVDGNGEEISSGGTGPGGQVNFDITNMRRVDGQDDTGGDSPPTLMPVIPQPPTVFDDDDNDGDTEIPESPTTPPNLQPPNLLIPALIGTAGLTPPSGGPGPATPIKPALNFGDLTPPTLVPPGGGSNNNNQGATTPPPTRSQQNNRCRCNVGVSQNIGNQLRDKIDPALNSIKDEVKNNAAQLGGLAALAALLQQVASAIGVGAFPIEVPASINKLDKRSGKNLNNLAESQLWQVEQLDSVMGQWCNTIEFDTPDGKKEMEVADLSDAISEILGMLAAQSINSGITQNAVIRNLIETGAVKQQAFLGHQYAKGNAEFLGYPGERRKTSMPMTFTPGKGLLEGLLGGGNVPVQGWKKTDNRDLGDVLNELLQAAAIIRAVYWRRLDPNGDMQGQLKDIIGRQAEFPETDRQREDEQAEENPDQDDWLTYLRAVETAFGPGDATNPSENPTPFGRDFSQRPKLTNKKPPEGLG